MIRRIQKVDAGTVVSVLVQGCTVGRSTSESFESFLNRYNSDSYQPRVKTIVTTVTTFDVFRGRSRRSCHLCD